MNETTRQDDVSPSDRWGDRLDAAIPHPSALSDPHAVLRAGRAAAVRRRRRRRRTLVAAAALAVVAGTGATAAIGLAPNPVGTTRAVGDDGAERTDVAGPGVPLCPVALPVPPTTRGVPVRTVPREQSPSLASDGTLLLPEGMRLVAAVEEPLGYEAPAHSLALAYESGFGERWTMLSLRPDWRTDGGPTSGVEEDGSAAYDQVAEGQGLTFAAWVRDQVAFGIGPQWPEAGLPDQPYLSLDGGLVLPAGVEVLERVDDPLALDTPRTSTAIAWTEDGSAVRWTLLVADPTWRPGDDEWGLVNGFGSRTAEPDDRGLRAWAESFAGRGFVADAPPAWVTGANP